MSIIKFPRNHNNKLRPHIKKMICIEFPGLIDRRSKEKEKGANYCEPTSFPGFSPTRPYGARETTGKRENLGTRLTANVVGREGLPREGKGRRLPRSSEFAKRTLRSQLRRIFAELHPYQKFVDYLPQLKIFDTDTNRYVSLEMKNYVLYFCPVL